MKVLFLSKPGNSSPWFEDFCAELGPHYEVVFWSPDQPFADQVAGAPVVVDLGAPLTPEMVEAAHESGVRLWQLISAGYDHLDLASFREKGILVANTPGQFSAPALAEQALLLMLCIARSFRRSQEDLRRGTFYRTFGDELSGKTLGLVGLGASGGELARLARALRMDVLAIDPSDAVRSTASELAVEFLGGPDSLGDLLARSDYVSIHVPLTDETRGMFDAERFAVMKSSAVLINVARGGIVDQQALTDALRNGTIRAAGLDVFAVEPIDADDPLLKMENVVATPHVAGATHETSRRRGSAAADNVKRIAGGIPPLFEVTGA
jgi:phosphoglycerate dehydrogenase-like enzyme